jgi:hypothetical protein
LAKPTTAGTAVAEAGEAALAKTEERLLFRGVAGPKTSLKMRLAKQGVAKPRGTKLDAASLEKHVRNEDVASGVTSWTTKRSIAKRFSGPNGVILEVEESAVANRVVPRPPINKYLDEAEVLLKGTIQARPTKP